MASPQRMGRCRQPLHVRARAGGASAAPGSALKQISSFEHSGEPTDAPRSCNVSGIFGIERLHP
jgi:hypothetical protein